MNRIAVVLAAGKGTRMRSALPKVLHEAAGQPLLAWVVDAARAAGCSKILIVVGHGAEQVKEAIQGDDIGWVLQAEQRGTGHALQQAMPAIPDSHREIFEGMATAAKQAAAEVAELIETRDLNVAARIVSDDDQLDDLHEAAYSGLLVASFHGTPQQILDISLLARYFERFGDHAVSVSRRIVYLVTGDHNGERAAI